MDSLVLDKLPTRGLAATRRWPSCAARPKTSTRSCTASRTTSSFAWACATCWARKTCRRPPARWPTSPRPAWRRSPRASTSGWSPSSASRTSAKGRRAGQPCEMVILGMGKFGGREMNYHSDLDIVFLYEADGHTAADAGIARPANAPPTSTSSANWASGSSRPPAGSSALRAALRGRRPAASHRQERRAGHLASPSSPATSPKAAASFGSGRRCARRGWSTARPRGRGWRWPRSTEAAFGHRWRRRDAEEIRHMRQRLEDTAAAGDLKRGPGGIVDIEFLVQMLQLKHGREQSQAPHAQHPRRLARAATPPGCSRPTITNSSTPATGCCGPSKAGCG